MRWGEKGKGGKGDKGMGLQGCRIMGLAKKLQTNKGNIYHIDGYQLLGTRREGEQRGNEVAK